VPNGYGLTATLGGAMRPGASVFRRGHGALLDALADPRIDYLT
jgi:hypothetical protein